MSPTQRNELGIGEGSNDEEATTSDVCDWTSKDSQFWRVRTQPQNPIAQFNPDDPEYLGRQFGFQDPRVVTVDGYGAVQYAYSLTGERPSCNLALDVGPTSTVVVTYAENLTKNPDYARGCANADRLASAVLTTLRSHAAG